MTSKKTKAFPHVLDLPTHSIGPLHLAAIKYSDNSNQATCVINLNSFEKSTQS